MKRLIVLMLLTSPVLLFAQETRREVTHSSGNVTLDAKPNSDQVPDVIAMTAHLQRIVVLRFKYDTDLLAGLEKAIKQEKIKNAVILSGWGSVRNYQVHQVSNRELPPKVTLVKNPTAPADIANISGVVMNGRLHPHITLANPDKAFGGHLEPGTSVFTFAVAVLGVLDDGLNLTKLDDWTYR